jgi:hypothetical protein
VPEKTIQAILRHANVSTTNTYYIKSAADDTRAAMAKLESLVIGNEPATEEAENNQTSASDNEVATEAADAKPAAIQSTPLFYCRLNLVAAVGLEPTTYGL